MKRFTLLMLIVGLTSALSLTSCGNNAPSGGESPSPTETSPSPSPS